MGQLKPAFKEDGVIHAGNSSQISDGAAALLVMAEDNALSLGLTPIARYRAGAVTGADPVLMLTGPIPATEKVLHKSGVSLDEVGVYEVNEAFEEFFHAVEIMRLTLARENCWESGF